MLLQSRKPKPQMGFGSRSHSLHARPARKTDNGFVCSQWSERNLSNFMTKLCDINQAAKEKLPPGFSDKSGIGVHYTDAFLKPMNTKLPDGTRVSCKRKGLKITLSVGTKKGEGLMRRLEVSKDPMVMLSAALQEAAKAAGVGLQLTETEILLQA